MPANLQRTSSYINKEASVEGTAGIPGIARHGFVRCSHVHGASLLPRFDGDLVSIIHVGAVTNDSALDYMLALDGHAAGLANFVASEEDHAPCAASVYPSNILATALVLFG